MDIRDGLPRSRQIQIIRDWLQTNGARFYERSPRERMASLHWDDRSQNELQLETITPDFRVISPVPFSIEVIGYPWPSRLPSATRMKDELLALRVLSGMRLGPSLPMLGALARDDSVGPEYRVPYMDGTLFVDQLPALEDIRQYVKPDQTVKRILLEGEPRRLHFSDPVEVDARWKHALSLKQLESEADFPDDTLAVWVSSKFHEERQRRLNYQSQHTETRVPPNPGLIWSPTMSRVDRMIESTITAHLGGRYERFPIQWPGADGNLLSKEAKFWVSPSGRRVFIQTATVQNRGPHYPVLRLARHLITPWIYRSFGNAGDAVFLLLLAVSNQPAPPVAAVNNLESSGWIVMPWDFAEPDPAFLSYLRSVAEV